MEHKRTILAFDIGSPNDKKSQRRKKYNEAFCTHAKWLEHDLYSTKESLIHPSIVHIVIVEIEGDKTLLIWQKLVESSLFRCHFNNNNKQIDDVESTWKTDCIWKKNHTGILYFSHPIFYLNPMTLRFTLNSG